MGLRQLVYGVYERRLATDPAEYASSLLRATGTEWLLLDDGFPPPEEGEDWRRMGELAGCPARPVLRLESRGPDAAALVARARDDGYAALKTIDCHGPLTP